jgi:hypothetical protein
MKHKILIYTALSLVVCALSAQVAADRKATWDYPVKPGTKEWKSLDSYKARVDTCLIPERLLTSLSTAELTDLCLQYPLLCDIFAFDSFRDGINHVYDRFNGFRELFKRKDASKELLKRYDWKIKNLSLLKSLTTSIERGDLILSISKIELLLSRLGEESGDRVVSGEILQGLVTGYECKLNYMNFMSFGFATNYFSRACILSTLDRSMVEQLPQTDKNAVFFLGFTDAWSMGSIDRLSYQWIKQEK